MASISIPLAVPQFRSVRGLGTAVSILFIIQAVLELMLLLTTPTLTRLNSAATVSPSEAVLALGIAGLIFGWILILIAAAIVFLVWVHHSYSNLPALGELNPRFTPGWAVGWFFVPVMALFRPYQVVADTWRASVPHTSIDAIRSSPAVPSVALVGWWWFLFLLNNYAGYLTNFIDSSGLMMVSYGIGIVGAIVTVYMVLSITRNQHRKQEMQVLQQRVGG